MAGRRKVLGLMLVGTAIIVVAYAVYASILVTRSTNSLKLSTLYAQSRGPLQGQHLPAFTLPALKTNASVSSGSLTGKPLLVNFFASWCTPCQQETPMLARAARSYGAKVQFVGIDEGTVRAAELAFVQRTGISYPVLLDSSSALKGSFDLLGLPTTLLVLPNGTVKSEIIGELSQASLQSSLHAILGSTK